MGWKDSIQKVVGLPELVPSEFCKAHTHNVHDICYVLGIDPETVILRPCRDMADQAAMFHTDVDSLLLAKGCRQCDYRWTHGCDTSTGGWWLSKGAKGGGSRQPRKDHFAALKASESGKFRTQIMHSESKRISYVLPKIEEAAGKPIPIGWEGNVDDLAAFTGLPIQEISNLWRESVEDLRALKNFHISNEPVKAPKAKEKAKPRR